MPRPDRSLTKEEMEALERKMPNRDPLPNALGVKKHFGSIEAVEERRFPWLRERRRRRD